MPIFIHLGNLIIFVYSNEGPRPHVHVGDRKRSRYPAMKVWLDTLEVASSRGFTKQLERDILKLIKQRQDELLELWEDTFL